MDKYGIYKFTFSDGKTYIGQAKMPIEERWKNGEGYKGQDVYVPITLEGWNNVKKEVLHTNLTLEQANNLEKHYIQKFNSIKNGYNRKVGGGNSPTKTIIVSIPFDEKNFLCIIPSLTSFLTYADLQLILYLFENNNKTFLLLPSQIRLRYSISESSCQRSVKHLIDLNLLHKTKEKSTYIIDLDLSCINI